MSYEYSPGFAGLFDRFRRGKRRLRTGAGIPNRSEGRHLDIQGTVTTIRGTPVTGRVYVLSAGRIVAFVTIISGRYTVYDLGPGSYQLVPEATGVDLTPRNVTVGLSPITVNFVSGDTGSTEGGWTPTVMTMVPLSDAPDLTSGIRLVIQGTATTTRGTPAPGRIDVYRGGRVVGYTNTISGRYTVYDLPRGEYRLVLRPTSGRESSRNVTVGHSAITVNFVVS
jgi:hypothetical protein